MLYHNDFLSNRIEKFTDIPGLSDSSLTGADVPEQVNNEIENQISSQVNNSVSELSESAMSNIENIMKDRLEKTISTENIKKIVNEVLKNIDTKEIKEKVNKVIDEGKEILKKNVKYARENTSEFRDEFKNSIVKKIVPITTISIIAISIQLLLILISMFILIFKKIKS